MIRSRKGFTITEIVIGAAVLAVVMGLVLSLLVRSLDCVARVVVRAGNVQGRAVLARHLQLDLANAIPGSIKVVPNGVTLRRTRSHATPQTILYYTAPETHDVYRQVEGQVAERLAHNFQGAFKAELTEGKPLVITIDDAQSFALETRSRFAGAYVPVIPMN